MISKNVQIKEAFFFLDIHLGIQKEILKSTSCITSIFAVLVSFLFLMSTMKVIQENLLIS